MHKHFQKKPGKRKGKILEGKKKREAKQILLEGIYKINIFKAQRENTEKSTDQNHLLLQIIPCPTAPHNFYHMDKNQSGFKGGVGPQIEKLSMMKGRENFLLQLEFYQGNKTKALISSIHAGQRMRTECQSLTV